MGPPYYHLDFARAGGFHLQCIYGCSHPAKAGLQTLNNAAAANCTKFNDKKYSKRPQKSSDG